MLELVTSGGVLMWPIGLCSVVALGIIIERSCSLSRSQVLPAGVLQAAQDAPISDARAALGKSELARVLAQVLEAAPEGEAAMRERIAEALDAATLRLERSLNWLASIASVTPLLGLLGTVLGMIDVFAQLMVRQGSDPTPLAGGISEALITTAAGLSVAIPCLLCVGHFDRRVVRLSHDIESAARALLRQRRAAGA
ncbi:MAG: MotA/TolQ/ExbB proton channel family protein [Gammaproteobacteria bacterium]|nr:MotA/TolQ/ExbB proton channel family protein [Gammaproteobacteria bacterium]MCY4200690.1 MotA/TolQ/ExbB proton channel family protein [Gammaproteobacteria bacterium]MCY4324211.1 MotA/TolQ/ExbB proton channel family protein [Gammaproteobacteria bacterium]